MSQPATDFSGKNLIEEQWLAFFGQLRDVSGLDLRNYKQDQIRRRILGTVEAMGLHSLQDLGLLISNSPSMLSKLIDHLAINVTEFYRNPAMWDILRESVIPALLRNRRRLRCWSAGCSSGAEAYTLASILDEMIPGGFSILGTDIDSEALNRAQQAVYDRATIGSTPPEVLEKYFDQLDDQRYQVKKNLRNYTKFKIHNIFETMAEGSFDLIVCRNVLIYFTEESKELTYRRFYEAQAPGGYLFLGCSEHIFDSRGIGYLNPWPYIYRK